GRAPTDDLVERRRVRPDLPPRHGVARGLRVTAPLDVEALFRELMDIDSQNPDLAAGAAGERALAEAVARYLEDAGLAVEMHDVVGDRPNVIGTLPGTVDQPAVVLEAHLDTVPDPVAGLPVRVEGRRLY